MDFDELVEYEGEQMTLRQAALEILKTMSAQAKAAGAPIVNANDVLTTALAALPRV